MFALSCPFAGLSTSIPARALLRRDVPSPLFRLHSFRAPVTLPFSRREPSSLIQQSLLLHHCDPTIALLLQIRLPHKMVLWVFGYASLIWKAGFHYDERIVGFIKGYRRAFHLACYEHRGTDDLPARVATLETDDEAVCWGVAFCIMDAEVAERAMSYLHVRESEYDIVKSVPFYTEGSPNTPVVSDALVFMSTLDKSTNKYYLGAAPKGVIARQIATATGPCGPNCDYLFRLVEALREIGHEDEEVVELAVAVRRMLSECKAQAGQANMSASPRSLFAGQNVGTKPSLIMPGPIQVGPVSHSPRLLKSQAR